MHAFDLDRLAGRRLSCDGRAQARSCRRSTESIARSIPRCSSSRTPRTRVGDRRRDGRRGLRDRRLDEADGPRECVLPAGVGATHEQAARTEDGSLDAIRARRGHQCASSRHRARRCAARADSARGASRRRDRRLPEARRAAADFTCGRRGSSACSGWTCRTMTCRESHTAGIRGADQTRQDRPTTRRGSLRFPAFASTSPARSTSSKKSDVTTASIGCP